MISNNPILRLASKFAPREKEMFFGLRKIDSKKAFAVEWTDRQFFWTNIYWGYFLALFGYNVWRPYDPKDRFKNDDVVYNDRFDEAYNLLSYWESIDGYEMQSDDSWMVTDIIWKKII
jgi:hypothetical protein